MWACGCVLFEMLCGYHPFAPRKGDTEKSFYGRINKADFDKKSNNDT